MKTFIYEACDRWSQILSTVPDSTPKKCSVIFQACLLVAGSILASVWPLPVYAQKPAEAKPVVVQPGAPGKPTRALPAKTRAKLPPVAAADVQFMQGMIVHHAQAVEMTALIEEAGLVRARQTARVSAPAGGLERIVAYRT